MIAFISAD